ncbi:MAG: N-acetylmuramoyl-L-alanine amidase [Christensenellaceae bacterium]|nr:N-acetylmuramoyl-L-alanine amidase [Christensenellaceae bacterium]
MRKFIAALLIIILIMFLIVVGLLISKCSPATDADPTTAPSAQLSLETPGGGAAPATDNPTSEPTAEALPTEQPTPDYSGIPRAVTEGTLDDVFARLEQLKTLPEEAVIILLDVGHGGFDGGSVGVDTGAHEADLNLEVSRVLAEKLAEKGYYVFMTRMGDYALDQTKNGDMKKRTEIMKLDIFDVSVSIHMNSFPQDRSVKGARVYHYERGTESERLAEIVMRSICTANGTNYRSTITEDLMVVREPIAPSILVECGFISHPEEELNLKSPQYQNLLSQAIADGVESFLRGDAGVTTGN